MPPCSLELTALPLIIKTTYGNTIKQAAAYANRLGMRVVMDLDVRLARRAFLAAHPLVNRGL